ncbi:hypothetical protein KJ786_02725 [Patescibacteria group bacterium]|nr:hypothetical protein [Patescibacteria group bacterium]
MNFIFKTIFRLKKIKVIIVSGKGKSLAVESISHILESNFKVKKLIKKTPNLFDILIKNVFIIETNLESEKIFKKMAELVRLSPLPILVVTHMVEILKEIKQISELAQLIPSYGFLVLNFDDKSAVKINDTANLKDITFGFEQGADFMASDVNTDNEGANFKINHNGKSIPIWQDSVGKEHVYSALATSCVGTILGLNLVEISEALKMKWK